MASRAINRAMGALALNLPLLGRWTDPPDPDRENVSVRWCGQTSDASETCGFEEPGARTGRSAPARRPAEVTPIPRAEDHARHTSSAGGHHRTNDVPGVGFEPTRP